MRQVALAEVKDDLSRFLRLAESEEILITRHGKPAGVLIGNNTPSFYGALRKPVPPSRRVAVFVWRICRHNSLPPMYMRPPRHSSLHGEMESQVLQHLNTGLTTGCTCRAAERPAGDPKR